MDVPQKHFNNLSPAQAERLALLMEEMGEAQQVIGKILRHGYESYNPDLIVNQGAYPKVTNRHELTKELGHVLAAIDIAKNCGDISRIDLENDRIRKLQKVERWLHHTPVWGE